MRTNKKKQWNKTKSPERNPHICGQLILYKGAKTMLKSHFCALHDVSLFQILFHLMLTSYKDEIDFVTFKSQLCGVYIKNSFQQMVLGQLDMQKEKNEAGTISHAIHKM